MSPSEPETRVSLVSTVRACLCLRRKSEKGGRGLINQLCFYLSCVECFWSSYMNVKVSHIFQSVSFTLFFLALSVCVCECESVFVCIAVSCLLNQHTKADYSEADKKKDL